MAPLSFYFNTGIGIILVLVSMACFVFTIKSDTDYQPGRSVSTSFLTSTHEANRISAGEVTVIVAAKKSDVSIQVPNYFAQYQLEIHAAIEGTFLFGSGNEPKSNFRPVTEIVLINDNSHHFLNGLAFIDDIDQNTTHLSHNSSRDTISDSPSIKNDHSTFDAAFRPLSNLLLKDIPEGLPTLSASDLKISFEDTGTSKIHNKGSGNPSKDTLTVFTTCGHLDMTVLALEHLVHSLDVTDLLIVDDFSLDGTADYLRKKGFFVISKEKPMGLTDSWNKGYNFAVSMGYSYIIFANNDVLVPQGAIHSMRRDLRHEVLVVPLTTLKGAGHNPGQTLVLAFEMSVDIEDYVSNPNNVQLIQDALTTKVTRVKSGQTPRNVPAQVKGQHYGYESMDPSLLSDTNHLLKSVWKRNPRFNGFVFAINITGIQPAAYKYPLHLFDPSGLIIGQEDKLIVDMTKHGMVPKISLGAFVYHFKSITVKMSRNKKNEDGREDLSKYHSDLLGPKGSNSSLKSFYTGYGDIYVDKPFHRMSVYPSLDSNVGAEKSSGKQASKKARRKYTVIAFAVSDAVRNPMAGDIFTATELGDALLLTYQNVKIMYLSKGKDWYDPVKLQQVDVLVTLLDDYDLRKALQSHRSSILMDGPKPTLVTIAWARNWFHRWLKKSWMGNYDSIFTSSSLALKFFVEFGKRFGHRVECVHGCPMERAPRLSCVVPDTASSNSNTLKTPFEELNRSNSSTLNDLINVANENAASVFRNIFSGPSHKQSRLMCTLYLPKRNDFGVDKSKILRFDYLHNERGQGTFAPPNPRTKAVRDPALKPSYRAMSTYRTTVPVDVLQIATNIDKFKRSGDSYISKQPTSIASEGSNEKERVLLRTSDEDKAGAVSTNTSISESHLDSEDSNRREMRASQTIIKDSATQLKKPQKSLKTESHEKKLEIAFRADYAFTGSYYNVHRNIMNFDPSDLLPEFNGVIIGKGWATAPNVTSEFRKISIGSIPYQDLPKVYRRVKIVVDDANHVTAPWGSVNSRVFDALSSGALVITNGLLGSHETFNGRLPTYSTASELTTLLKYYLTNNAERESLTEELSKFVRVEHSYQRRGEEFANSLINLGITLEKHSIEKKGRITKDSGIASQKDNNLNVSSHSAPMRSICIGVRTYESHKAWLEILLRSLVAQHSKSPFSESLDLQIFIADTERNTIFLPSSSAPSSRFTFSHALEEIVNRVNKDLNPLRSPQAHVVWDVNSPKRTYKNPFYGYDETDNLVDFMANLPQCEWMMMTNGDNSYNSAWFDAVAPLANDKSIHLIGWDFITHHKRNGDGQQHIRISMERGFVDLASVLIRTSKIVESRSKYLPDAMFTDDLFARDFKILTELLKIIPSKAIRLLHRIFLLHQ